MRRYKLCKHEKNCTHKWYFQGHFKFLPFFKSILDPFLPLFWPLIIFWVNFLYIFICAYINCVIMLKIALINGIYMSIFNFYIFFTFFEPFFDPFFTLFLPFFGFWLYLGSNSKVFKIHIKAYLRFTITLNGIFFNYQPQSRI